MKESPTEASGITNPNKKLGFFTFIFESALSMLGPRSSCIGNWNRNEKVKIFQNDKEERGKTLELIIALDISMGKSYKVLYDGQTCLSEGEILHNKFGFQALLEEIHSLPEEPKIVFESTGIYSKPVETFCQKNNLTYFLLNPLEANTFVLRKYGDHLAP